ncbi:MAG: hypothetical protein R6V10_03200 [bacterium]
MTRENQVKNKGTTRRVFINRSLTAAGSAVFLSQAHAWPAWASEGVTGDIERMGRICYDPETGRRLVSWMRVEVTTKEIQTRWGPTRTSEATDRILVKTKDAAVYGRPVEVSAGQPHAKLDPRIDARNGKACLAWCAMDYKDRSWRVYASYSSDEKSWGKPVQIAGGARPALHPEVAMDPETGRAWIAYEDWKDGSVRLTSFDGRSKTKPVKLSEGENNFRPRLIVTRKSGRHEGAVAISWDSYRDGQYDVFLRLVKGRSPGPEHRVTESPLWDCDTSIAEDKDGNIWVAWYRASNELNEFSKHRVIHARFYDGENWSWPLQPEGLPERDNGRLTGYGQCIHPFLQVDEHNRVHLFYRDHSEFMWGFVRHIIYEGDRWTEPDKVHEYRATDALNFMWEYSVTLTDNDMIEGVYDSLYVKRLGFASELHHLLPTPVPAKPGARYRTRGESYPEKTGKGWPVLEKAERATMELGVKKLTLLYGDTHSHSWTSDGVDPPDWYYHFARDFARLDYYAISDHDFTISNTPGLECYIAFLPKMFDSPDMVCFQAYEFSSQKTGHRVVLFEGDYYKRTFPLTFPPRNKSNTNQYLYPFLHKFAVSPDSRVLVTAHNMYKLGNNFIGHDQSLEPLYDVTSNHVPAEKPVDNYLDKDELKSGGIWVTIGSILKVARTRKQKDNWHMCWRDCLNAGLPLGAYGTSDTHSANGIGYVTSAVWAKKKDRKHIFDAMFERRSLGLDSNVRSAHMATLEHPSPFEDPAPPMNRADVRFYLDGHPMGKSVNLDSAPVARAYARNTNPADPVRAVVFIKDGKEVRTEFVKGNPADIKWKDKDFDRGRHYYYVRVELQNGGLAFSSPVFVNYRSGRSE